MTQDENIQKIVRTSYRNLLKSKLHLTKRQHKLAAKRNNIDEEIHENENKIAEIDEAIRKNQEACTSPDHEDSENEICPDCGFGI